MLTERHPAIFAGRGSSGHNAVPPTNVFAHQLLNLHAWDGCLILRLKVKERKGYQRGRGRSRMKKESVKVGLRREDALIRSKRSVVVNQIATGLR